jgi:hypothetical protein
MAYPPIPKLSKLLASGNLACMKKGFGILALTAKLEGAEILVPRPCGYIWLGLQPDPQLIEVVEVNIYGRACARSDDCGWRREFAANFQFVALLTENQAP